MSDNYQPHIFYNFEIKDLEEFKKDAINYSYTILVEQKYKNGVSHREKSALTLEQTLKLIDDKEDIKIVYRMKRPMDPSHLEITFVKDWYFVWCHIDLKHEPYFAEKYNLKQMNLA